MSDNIPMWTVVQSPVWMDNQTYYYSLWASNRNNIVCDNGNMNHNPTKPGFPFWGYESKTCDIKQLTMTRKSNWPA